MQIKYLGITTGQCTVQGPSGPVTHDVPQGGALALFRVEGFTEGSHAILGGLAANGAATPIATADPTAQVAANLIGHLQAALANDGRVSLSEMAQLGQDLAAHPDLQAVIQKSVGKWIGLVVKEKS